MTDDRKNKKERKYLKFSARELRAILLLIPFLAVAAWIIYAVSKPRTDTTAALLGDTLVAGSAKVASGLGNAVDMEAAEAEFFRFDPNTVTYEELRLMGIAKGTAAGIVKYRERGKVFQITEDFATCYGITDSMYAALKPYINIAPEFAPKRYPDREPAQPRSERRNQSNETILPEKFDPNEYTAEDFRRLGFSEKQSAVIVNYRESREGFRSPDDLAGCYVVSPEMYDRLKERIAIEPRDEDLSMPGMVDINTADSLTLTSVRGIGPKTASAIIAYRKRLGGFFNINQLAELKVVNEGNFELMSDGIWADSCIIQKIDINFAAPNAVGDHPYMSGKKLRKILRNRQLRGGWSTIEEMVEDNTLSPQEAAKLAPYLRFTTTTE